MTVYTVGANTGNSGGLTVGLLAKATAAAVLSGVGYPSVSMGSTSTATLSRLLGIATFPVSGPGTVTSARLWLRNRDAAAVTRAYEMRAVITLPVQLQASWNNRATATPWNVAGALTGTDVNATVIATGTAPTTAETQFYLEGAGLDAWIQGCIDGSISVPSFIVSAVDEASAFANYNRVNTDTGVIDGNRPTLVFDFTPAVPPSVSVNDVLVSRVSGTASFTVSLSSTYALPVTVDYATADDTATAPADYTATSGTLTFAPGESVKTVEVTIVP